MVQAKLAHVAVGCNAATNALAVAVNGASSLSASCNYCGVFVSRNSVCLLSSSVGSDAHSAPLKVVETLTHHEATANATRLTTVRLQSDGQSGTIKILAGDSEGRVFLWTRSAGGHWAVQKLPSDEQMLLTVAVAAVAIAKTRRRILYVVAFSDGTLAVYGESDRNGMKLLSRLELGAKSIMEAIEVTVVKSGDDREQNVLLATGGVDGKVHLFEVAGGENEVVKVLELEGHKDWIRSLAFDRQSTEAGDVVMLASASQDQRIRLWKITTRSKVGDTGEASAGEVKDKFLAHGRRWTYTVSFNALLFGHEDWVTSVHWMQVENEAALLSSSMDNTLIVWTKAADARGSWSPTLRVGEMGGNGLLSAGALPTCDGRLNLMSLGFAGQLERWEQQPAPSNLFLPAISVNGHCAEVTDLSWSPHGDYLASVSLDQTARVLAPFTLTGNSFKRTTEWYEISRAQVHGYDLNCGCFLLGERPKNDQFISGADEKILRVFKAPDKVNQLVKHMKLSGDGNEANTEVLPGAVLEGRTVQHAYLPELSLTNKAAQVKFSTIETGDGYAKLNKSVSLPVGDRLGRKTLWPEQCKLYGHGNELLSVTSSHAGDLIASACKAREERYAAVRLWNTTDWSEAQLPLEGHKSSVVQLAFSPNDQLLLSVSRDRQFCLYERETSPDGQFALVECVKAHRRIIWSCSWSPDSNMFALGSRDQSISLWNQVGGKWAQACELVTFETAVTAVAFSPRLMESTAYFLAVGLETGAIRFFTVAQDDKAAVTSVNGAGEIDWELSASSAISRLAWSPAKLDNESVLAAASNDNSVRVYTLLL